MLAKLTAKNQLTLPKAATNALGPVEYFEVETRHGTIVLTPVRIQRGDAVRARLAELALTPADVAAAVTWTRQGVAEPRADYATAAGTGKRPSRKADDAAPARRKDTRRPGKPSRKA